PETPSTSKSPPTIPPGVGSSGATARAAYLRASAVWGEPGHHPVVPSTQYPVPRPEEPATIGAKTLFRSEFLTFLRVVRVPGTGYRVLGYRAPHSTGTKTAYLRSTAPHVAWLT